MNRTKDIASRRSRPAERLALTLLLAVLSVFGGTSTASAGFWANEAAMMNDPDTRATFIADPGHGELWSRGGLIASHGQYYRERGSATSCSGALAG